MDRMAKILIAGLSAALAAGTAVAKEQRIGAAAAVVPATAGMSVSGFAVEIIDGSDVFHRQRVVTEAEGRAQLIFLDGSAVTVGPKSEVMLDEFVYDPDARLSGATIKATRGVLRYVGGKISKTVDVQIQTPTATIGIRGGIVVVDIDNGGRTNAYFLYGERMSMTANGVTQVAQRAGSVISFTPGQTPTAPRMATPGEMRDATRGLQANVQPRQPGQPGQQPGQQGQARGAGPVGQGNAMNGGPMAQQPVGQGQPGQGQPGQGQPGQGQLGQNPQPGNGGPVGQGMAPAGGQPGGGVQLASVGGVGPGMLGVGPAPGGAPMQTIGSVNAPTANRGVMAARFDNALSGNFGRMNANNGPRAFPTPNLGNLVRQGPMTNGPRPEFGPRPGQIDRLGPQNLQGTLQPMLMQNGMPPPPPPPPK